MKISKHYIINILFLIISASVMASAPTNNLMLKSRFIDRPALLQHHLEKREFFLLRKSYNRLQSKLSTKDRFYYKAYIDNAFNQCFNSNSAIKSLLTTHKKALTDSMVANLLILQIDNYVKIYDYKAAANTGSDLLKKYTQAMDSATITDTRNSNILWRALEEVPPQTIIEKKDSYVKWQRDKANLINIPVTIREQQNDFVFDTGANISTITESYARQLHLKLINTTFDLASATSISNKSSVAIADKLTIGNIELSNVVFLVLPDEQLSFPQIDYKINGIIGFPVISQLGEIHVKNIGELFIPKTEHKEKYNNLAVDGLTPVVNLRTDKDSLMFTFDTGAKQTELSTLYFNKFKEEITQVAKLDSVSKGGAGGVVKVNVYKLPEFNIYNGPRKITLQKTDVLTSPDDRKIFYYGNIGQDFISNFKEMVLNFKQMYIKFDGAR